MHARTQRRAARGRQTAPEATQGLVLDPLWQRSAMWRGQRINLPLTAREIQAVVFFKIGSTNEVRVSMRSKYDVDVRAVANVYGGGGHKNASGFTVPGTLAEVRPQIIERLAAARRRQRGQQPAVGARVGR